MSTELLRNIELSLNEQFGLALETLKKSPSALRRAYYTNLSAKRHIHELFKRSQEYYADEEAISVMNKHLPGLLDPVLSLLELTAIIAVGADAELQDLKQLQAITSATKHFQSNPSAMSSFYSSVLKLFTREYNRFSRRVEKEFFLQQKEEDNKARQHLKSVN